MIEISNFLRFECLKCEIVKYSNFTSGERLHIWNIQLQNVWSFQISNLLLSNIWDSKLSMKIWNIKLAIEICNFNCSNNWNFKLFYVWILEVSNFEAFKYLNFKSPICSNIWNFRPWNVWTIQISKPFLFEYFRFQTFKYSDILEYLRLRTPKLFNFPDSFILWWQSKFSVVERGERTFTYNSIVAEPNPREDKRCIILFA